LLGQGELADRRSLLGRGDRVRRVEARRDSGPMLAGRLGGNAGFRVLLARDLFARGGGPLGRIGGIISRIQPCHFVGRSGRRGGRRTQARRSAAPSSPHRATSLTQD
jgi:hypothetical protein